MGIFKKNNKKPAKKKSSRVRSLNSPYRKSVVEGKKKRRKKNIASKSVPSGRIKTTPQSSKWKIVLAFFLSILIIGYGTYAVFLSDIFLIDSFIIEEDGTIIEDNEAMNTILRSTLGKNLVLINDEELISKIRESQPEIEKITIKKIFPDKIKVEHKKYPTVANLINIVDVVQKKFLVDSQGFLVEENIEHPDLPHIYYETDEFLEVRNSFLSDPKRSKERLTQIINAINLFEEKFAMKILYAEYKHQEREVHLVTERRFYVMIDLEKDLLRQIEKLKKALPKLDIYNEPLIYIDLRISGTNTEKVIFKRS